MPLVEIQNVLRHESDSQLLRGFAIDDPRHGTAYDVHAVHIGGWVLARGSTVKEVEVVYNGKVIRTALRSKKRPDVARVYSDVHEAGASGFSIAVGLVGMATSFQLIVQAALEDGTRIRLATIQGRHRSLEPNFKPKLQPLMVTTFGRSGSTWLMYLLSQHPQIIADRIYPYETQAASYWMHMLKVLSQPADHIKSSHPEKFLSNLLWVGHNPYYTGALTSQAPHHQCERAIWLGRTYIEELANFCQRSIEQFYQAIAKSQEKNQPLYFAEKWSSWNIGPMFWELYPKVSEIILVRDFRDVLCSVRSFNQKRGFLSFGRESVNSEEEYLQLLKRNSFALLEIWRSRRDRVHLIRYEDLVLRPHEVLESLLNYLNLDASLFTIRATIETASKATPDLVQHQTSEDPKTSIGRWRRDLTSSMQAACEEAFIDFLNEFGYTD
jgi:hypothetical protein